MHPCNSSDNQFLKKQYMPQICFSNMRNSYFSLSYMVLDCWVGKTRNLKKKKSLWEPLVDIFLLTHFLLTNKLILKLTLNCNQCLKTCYHVILLSPTNPQSLLPSLITYEEHTKAQILGCSINHLIKHLVCPC